MKALAADIGGTRLRAALVDDQGGILDRRDSTTPQDPKEGVALLRSLWGELGSAAASADAIAGTIRASTGEVTQSPNLPRWDGVRLCAELSCEVLNDANAAVLGEAWLGGLRRVFPGSSDAIKSALRRIRMARSVRSSTFPIGTATRKRTPGLDGGSPEVISVPALW